MKNYSMCSIDFCRLRVTTTNPFIFKLEYYKFAILVYQSGVSTVFMHVRFIKYVNRDFLDGK